MVSLKLAQARSVYRVLFLLIVWFSFFGMDALLVGFGLDDDRVHSPNEKFDLRCLRGGIKSHAGMIAAFAEHRTS